jgi:hypothetical protein
MLNDMSFLQWHESVCTAHSMHHTACGMFFLLAVPLTPHYGAAVFITAGDKQQSSAGNSSCCNVITVKSLMSAA